jgi:hypothetical protein
MTEFSEVDAGPQLQLTGARVFAPVPVALRRSLLELEAVKNGGKPAALILLTASEFAAAMPHFRAYRLSIVAATPSKPPGYLQVGPDAREQLTAERQIKLCVAPNDRDARRLAEYDERADYERVGMLLGYPECCVLAAAARDQIRRDDASGVERQGNLIDAALAASTHLDVSCNILLRERALCGYGPASIISHYPCSFNCARTVALADTYHHLLVDKWPRWARQLEGLLRSPVLLWSDRSWPSQFWDEMAGVVHLGGSVDRRGQRISNGFSLPLGFGRTPGGSLPSGAVEIDIGVDATSFHLPDGTQQLISHASAGPPVLLDWRSGRMQRHAELT